MGATPNLGAWMHRSGSSRSRISHQERLTFGAFPEIEADHDALVGQRIDVDTAPQVPHQERGVGLQNRRQLRTIAGENMAGFTVEETARR